MHFLDRSQVPVPECLVAPEAGRTYEHLRGSETAQIRTELLKLQLNRCAYCERRTGDQPEDGHIEHFRDQSGHKGQTLDWSNMFWSCKDERTCGKHKDKCRKFQGVKQRFDPSDLIDPSRDDPDGFLLFVSDGTVTPRSDLDEANLRRANETIRVFQLNESALLTRARHDAIKPYVNMITTLLAFGPEILRRFVSSELEDTASTPFSTSIKHFLLSVTP